MGGPHEFVGWAKARSARTMRICKVRGRAFAHPTRFTLLYIADNPPKRRCSSFRGKGRQPP